MIKTCFLSLSFSLMYAFSPLSLNGGLRQNEAEPLYDISEMLSPFYEGEVSYAESIMPVRKKDGTIPPIDLLYPIEEVFEVKSADLRTTYVEGQDFSVENGQFIVNPSGRIKSLSYLEFHPTDGQPGFESRNGGYVLWKEGSWFHERQTVITYKHQAGYANYIPEGKGYLLANLHEKLAAKKDINLLVYGDSISTGGNSSGHPDIHVSPYMPIYPELFKIGIERTYNVKVNLFNASVGGTDSAWGSSKLRSEVLSKYSDIDLAIVAFGMNDTTRDPDGFASNINTIARGLRSKYKGVDLMLIATMLPNEEAPSFYGHQAEFYRPLKELEQQGTVAVDMGGVHAGLLKRKNFVDMTGNNINHANDYLGRIYAQTLLRTLEVSEYGQEDPIDEPSSSEIPQSSVPTSVPSEEPSASEEPVISSSSESNGQGENPAPKGCGGSLPIGGIAVTCSTAFYAFLRRKKSKK